MNKLISIFMVGFALMLTANAQTVTHEEHQTTTEIQSMQPSWAERKAHERSIKSQAKEAIVQARHRHNMTTTNRTFIRYSVSDFRMRHRPMFNMIFHDREWYLSNGYQIVLIDNCPYYYDVELNGYVPAFGFYEGCEYPDNGYVIYYH